MSARKHRVSAVFKRDYFRRPSQLRDLHSDARHLTHETVESTRRMLRLTHECQDAGIQTAVLLNAQEEKLNLTESHLHGIHGTLNEAHQDLGKLEYGEELEEKNDWRLYLCYVCCKCYKCRNIDANAPVRKPDAAVTGPKVPVPNKPQKSAAELKTLYASKANKRRSKTGMVARIMNDSQEDEMTKNLDEVSSIISSLKVIAEDVGSTVDKSNKQIDKLLGITSKEHEHLTWAQRRASNLTKR